MSMYNMLFGFNPLAGVLLRMLEIEVNSIPRFRDCFLAETNDGDNCICIHTRTGGGNREDYEEDNDDMAGHKLYIYDEDDDFDCTYANFFYDFPEDYKDDLTNLCGEDIEKFTPSDKWIALFETMKAEREEL